VVVGLGVQLVQGDVDLPGAVAVPGQPGREQAFLDVAVAVAAGPVAQVAVLQLVAEQGNDAVLGGTFGLADGAHMISSTAGNLVAATGQHVSSASRQGHKSPPLSYPLRSLVEFRILLLVDLRIRG
jgi:hypothetical protein